MKFRSGTVALGEGRLSFADYRDGSVRVILGISGALKLRRYNPQSKKLSTATLLSYAEDCAFVYGGRIESVGGLYYVPES